MRRAAERAQSAQMNIPGVAARALTRRRGYTPPQQPQRARPGTAAKAAGNANMPDMVFLPDRPAKRQRIRRYRWSRGLRLRAGLPHGGRMSTSPPTAGAPIGPVDRV